MLDRRNIFILDTNVILHDSTCINHFDEHDIVFPITALEELDGFKKGSQIFAARDHFEPYRSAQGGTFCTSRTGR